MSGQMPHCWICGKIDEAHRQLLLSQGLAAEPDFGFFRGPKVCPECEPAVVPVLQVAREMGGDRVAEVLRRLCSDDLTGNAA